jgi:transposase
MSTSLLYHAYYIKGYDYVRTHYEGGKIRFVIRHRPQRLRCAVCNSSSVICRGQTERTFRAPPIGSKPVEITLAVQRVECRRCGRIRQAKVDFADPRRRYTRSFERYALELSRCMTIKDVANHLGVSWDVIKDIQKRFLQRHFSKPKLSKLQWIAIDEISIGRGHRYITVVLDLKSGAVVYVGQGKGADALDPFWRRLKRSRAKVEAVAMDMSPAYISAVSTNLPQAAIVFDHFHIIKLFNDKLSNFRRWLQSTLTDECQAVLKGIRWLILKNPEKLDDDKGELERLERALQLNEPLATAYYMGDELRLLWFQEDKEAAGEFLDDWCRRAKVSGVRMLRNFAKTLQNHRAGILSWYDYPISTGPLEGTNNKIQTMKRQAYGYRDEEFFRLKIYAAHLTKYALVG